MYGLSFSESFFSGETDVYEIEPSEEPTSVLQAIISLDDDTKRGIARDVLGTEADCVEFYINSESFPFDVLEKVRETDLCDTLSSPITVYVDRDQLYSVTVYEA